LTNLSDCIYEVIKNEYSNLVNSILEEPSQEETTPIAISNKESTKVSQKGKGERNDYDINRFEKVMDLIKNGHTLRSIAKSLQMSRNVVRRYSKMDTLIKKAIYYRNNYSEYQEFIEKELSEGKCIKEIFGSVKKAGFNGGITSFYEYFKDYSDHANSPKKSLSSVKHRIISPRKISRYLKFTDLTNIKDNFDRNNMTALLSKSKLLKEIRMQLLSFKDLLLGNDVSLLDDWMKKTYSLEKSQLQTFVKGLNIDIEAVRNAIITNWSNGQVEGQVNRLKTIKRQMYGRAGFELLRKKVILGKVG
jgi:transposase